MIAGTLSSPKQKKGQTIPWNARQILYATMTVLNGMYLVRGPICPTATGGRHSIQKWSQTNQSESESESGTQVRVRISETANVMRQQFVVWHCQMPKGWSWCCTLEYPGFVYAKVFQDLHLWFDSLDEHPFWDSSYLDWSRLFGADIRSALLAHWVSYILGFVLSKVFRGHSFNSHPAAHSGCLRFFWGEVLPNYHDATYHR